MKINFSFVISGYCSCDFVDRISVPTKNPIHQITMSETNNNLKERVRDFWQAHPCGSKFATAELGTKEFFELIEAHRYESERHIPIAADFASAKGKRVLEIGCGVGTDGVQFAKAGALYTGVDLTTAAVELAKKNFELRGLSGTLQTADAEKLGFPDESFTTVAFKPIH